VLRERRSRMCCVRSLPELGSMPGFRLRKKEARAGEPLRAMRAPYGAAAHVQDVRVETFHAAKGKRPVPLREAQWLVIHLTIDPLRTQAPPVCALTALLGHPAIVWVRQAIAACAVQNSGGTSPSRFGALLLLPRLLGFVSPCILSCLSSPCTDMVMVQAESCGRYK
jgi:hypothetical protein